MSSSENLFQNLPNQETDETAPREIDILRQRAKLLGVPYSGSTGIETLRKNIQAKLDAEQAAQDAQENQEAEEEEAQLNEAGLTNGIQNPVNPNVLAQVSQAQAPLVQTPSGEPIQTQAPQIQAPTQVLSPAARQAKLRQELLQEQTRLVRLRITNLDPKKKDLPGEIFTVANEYIGTIRKYVPFGEQTDNGYHVPYCIYQMMKERTFVHIKLKKDPRTGVNTPEVQHVREFALEELPPLTEQELKDLAAAQAAKGGL